MATIKAESKAHAKDRLVGEGRWEEAVRFREQQKAEGKSPDEAWRLLLEAFPPAKPSTDSEDSTPRRRRRRRAGRRTDWKADIEWVYENLDVDNPGPAPSAGAESLLNEAKKNRWDFYTTFVTKLLPSRAKEDAGQRDGDDGRVLSLIDRVLETYGRKGDGAGAAVSPPAIPGVEPPAQRTQPSTARVEPETCPMCEEPCPPGTPQCEWCEVNRPRLLGRDGASDAGA